MEVQTFPVIYLIPLSHFSFPLLSSIWAASLFHLIVYLCHSKLNFGLSLLCLTPLFSILLSPLFLLPVSPFAICLSHQNKILHSHPTVDIPSPAPEEKAKKYIKPQFSDLCVTARKNIIMTVWRGKERP